MQGLFIFSTKNDLIYFKINYQLRQHIIKLALQNRQLEKKLEDEEEVPYEILVHMFSPMVTSHHLMQAEFFNNYNYILCDDETLTVFKEDLGFLFLSVSQNETKETARRRLGVFIELVKMLYGPAIQLLRDEQSYKTDRISILSKLLNYWEEEREKDQSFLLEAIERLIVNEAISEISLQIVKHTLNQIRSHALKEESIHTAMLFVNNKLMSEYSSRNACKVSKTTPLFLVLLSSVLRQESVKDSKDNQSVEVKSKWVEISVEEESIQTTLENFSMSTGSNKSNSFKQEDVVLTYSCNIEMFQHIFLFLRHRDTDDLIPHVIYRIHINDQITLIFLSEVYKYNTFTASLNRLALYLHSILVNPNTALLQEKLTHEFQKLSQAYKRLKFNTEEERKIRLVIGKWNQLNHQGFLSARAWTHPLTPHVEAVVLALRESIKEVFGLSAFQILSENWSKLQMNMYTILTKVQNYVISKISPYQEYLIVKSQQNISLTYYSHDYPDLLHFIFVDRGHNCLIAPALMPDSPISKADVWKLTQFAHRQVSKGFYYVSCRDPNYRFCYLLWFENKEGTSLRIKANSNFDANVLPGVLGVDFYKKLANHVFTPTEAEEVTCYELYMFYKASMDEMTIMKNIQQLLSHFWDLSGASFSALNRL